MNQTPGQPDIAPSPEIEKKPVVSLLIDDKEYNVTLMQNSAKHYGWKNFSAVLCHTIESAKAAISAVEPDIIFLDHSLTRDGDEGLEIAIWIRETYPNMKIYSTTGIEANLPAYENMLTGHVDKQKPKEIGKIIEPK